MKEYIVTGTGQGGRTLMVRVFATNVGQAFNFAKRDHGMVTHRNTKLA